MTTTNGFVELRLSPDQAKALQTHLETFLLTKPLSHRPTKGEKLLGAILSMVGTQAWRQSWRAV